MSGAVAVGSGVGPAALSVRGHGVQIRARRERSPRERLWGQCSGDDEETREHEQLFHLAFQTS